MEKIWWISWTQEVYPLTTSFLETIPLEIQIAIGYRSNHHHLGHTLQPYPDSGNNKEQEWVIKVRNLNTKEEENQENKKDTERSLKYISQTQRRTYLKLPKWLCTS